MTTRKYQAQVDELETIMKRTGFTLDEIARKTGINPRTLRNAATGGVKLGDYKMNDVRNVGTLPVYKTEQISESGVPYGDPVVRLRYIPVVSWAQAGNATAYEDLPADWMRRVACDTKDPKAFGVDIVGDSMEPNYREGETAILVPSVAPGNGNLVVANLKKQGPLLKLYHVSGNTVKLTSFNPAYPPYEFQLKDFHWIYPVETVVKRVLH